MLSVQDSLIKEILLNLRSFASSLKIKVNKNNKMKEPPAESGLERWPSAQHLE